MGVIQRGSDASMGQAFPLDGASLGVVEATTLAEVSAMIVTARNAQLSWHNLGFTARGKIIRRAAEELALETDALVKLVREETGKQSSLAHGELAAAIEMAEMMAAYGRFASGALFPSAIPGRQIRVERVPHGVAALIVAFNTPLPNYAWKVFPALMAGNSAILKPSPHTPLSAQLFVDVLHRSGVPHGVLQIAQGGAETAQALVTGDVNLVSFTGSYDAGVAVSEAAAGSLKKLILELGGSNPLIVCDDADIAQAVTTALQSAYSNAGQRCAAGSRILVMKKCMKLFVPSFSSRVIRGPGARVMMCWSRLWLIPRAQRKWRNISRPARPVEPWFTGWGKA